MKPHKSIPPLKSQASSKKPTDTLSLAKLYLTTNYDLRYNVVLSRNEFKLKSESEFRQLDDRTVNTWYTLFKMQQCMVSKNDWQMLLHSEFVLKYDPFVQYFSSLPEWDQKTDYIRRLSETVDTNQPEYWYKHLKKWLVGAVANATLYGENHLALVFSGAQGVGKTKWLEKLVPLSLSEYAYTGSIDPGNKDSRILLVECLLINLDELEVTSRREMASLKSLMTIAKTRERKAYRADAETLYRRASFVGSVNDATFLVDSTGSRRFLCHIVNQIDINHKIDLDKVYAQAYYLLNVGFIYYLTQEDQAELERSNVEFKVVTIEQEIICKYFIPGVDKAPNSIYMNTSRIIEYLISKEESVKLDNSALRAFGSALTTLKFPRVKKNGLWVYVLEHRDDSRNHLEVVTPALDIAC